jgi:hypothetical protein
VFVLLIFQVALALSQRLIMINALAIIRKKDRRAIFHGKGSLCFSTIRSEITPTPMKNGKIARAELKISARCSGIKNTYKEEFSQLLSGRCALHLFL